MVLVSLIISIIALAMAIMVLPTVFQMIWGKPTLLIGFGSGETTQGRFLNVELYNPPIRNRLLKWFGVRRMTAGDIMGTFSIEEYGSKKVVFPGEVPKIITHDGTEGHQRISLAASPFPAVFGVVLAVNTKKEVIVFEDEQQKTVFAPGKYCVCIRITIEGRPVEKRRNFIVCKTHPFVYWDVNS